MQLSDIQMDAISEVMSIGGGHATTALAKALNKEMDLKIPSVEICPLEDIPNKIGKLDLATFGVYTEVLGDLKGCLLTIFSERDALTIASILSGKKVTDINDFSVETVTTIADALAEGSLGAISDFFEMEINTSGSETAFDMLGALLQQVILDMSQHSDTVLFSRTEIFLSSERFNCHQTLFLESTSLEHLKEALEDKL